MNSPMIVTKSRRDDAERYHASTRVYFFPEEESILDNLMNRRNRPVDAYRALLADALTRAGFNDCDAIMLAKHARWSQKAGCKCGCSPGFVLRESKGYEVFVHIGAPREPAIFGGV